VPSGIRHRTLRPATMTNVHCLMQNRSVFARNVPVVASYESCTVTHRVASRRKPVRQKPLVSHRASGQFMLQTLHVLKRCPVLSTAVPAKKVPYTLNIQQRFQQPAVREGCAVIPYIRDTKHASHSVVAMIASRPRVLDLSGGLPLTCVHSRTWAVTRWHSAGLPGITTRRKVAKRSEKLQVRRHKSRRTQAIS
jgi:hypothetical protein